MLLASMVIHYLKYGFQPQCQFYQSKFGSCNFHKVLKSSVQQNNNVIYVVNLGAEAKRFTHKMMQSIDTLSIPQGGEGSGGGGASS